MVEDINENTESKKDKEFNKDKEVDKLLKAELGFNKKELKKFKKKLEKEASLPEKGIQTWFRLTSRNLYTRLKIVDTKANILITANALIISIALGGLYPKMGDDPHLMYGLGALLITNVISIAFAIFAAIPPKNKGVFNKNNINEADFMTFNDWHKMPLDVYEKGVLEVIDKNETLYPSIIADVHFIGALLGKKYALIRKSFLVFLYGIIISIAIFGFCHLFFDL